MKKLVLQNTITATALLAAISYAGIVSAHEASGSLGKAAGAVDVYQTTCSKNKDGATGKFVTHIKAVKAAKTAPLISIQAYKGKFATNSTDANGTDAAYSPDAIITKGGEGVYTILVDKSGAGVINYSLETHCNTATGTTHSGQTEPVQLQQQ